MLIFLDSTTTSNSYTDSIESPTLFTNTIASVPSALPTPTSGNLEDIHNPMSPSSKKFKKLKAMDALDAKYV